MFTDSRREHVDDLEWYFSHGVSTFYRSTFGDMIDAMDRYAVLRDVCDECDGSGIVDASGEWCEKCSGTGTMTTKTPGKHQRRCPACRSGGRQAMVSCPECSGMGLTPLTAKPSPRNHVPPASIETGLDVNARFGRISRRLRALSPLHRCTLEQFHGDRGAADSRVSATTARSRLCSIYSLTELGRQHNLNEIDVDVQSLAPTVERGDLLERCRQQALELYRCAIESYEQAAVAVAS